MKMNTDFWQVLVDRGEDRYNIFTFPTQGLADDFCKTVSNRHILLQYVSWELPVEEK